MSTNRKTAVITGGNSGVGFETAKALVAKGWRVVITGRDRDRLKTAIKSIEQANTKNSGGQVVYQIGDFENFDSVRALAAELNKEPRIDVLLNNIGISLNSHQVTNDGNDRMVQVNHLSHFLLTNLLLDKLKASTPARIINVSSRLHRRADGYGFEDFQFERSFFTLAAYGRTKLYNILFTRELSKLLQGSDVTVNALHPGIIATNIGEFSGVLAYLWSFSKIFQKPQFMAARVTLFAATSPDLEGITGKYYTPWLREKTPSRLAQNDGAARRLWIISATLTGLDDE